MPRIRYIGGYEAFKCKQDEELKQQQQQNPQGEEKTVITMEQTSDSEEEEVIPTQTFPGTKTTIKIMRQTENDLTCGLRSLQNMYGPSICDKEEMDNIASELQSRSHGIELYNPDLGYYAAEVLEAVLQKKGKWTQRIDIDKIPCSYYVPIIKCNPTFTGYIATIGMGVLNHYITVRISGSNYRKIDSLPGVQPIQILEEDLFHRRADGHIYCNKSDKEPIIALTAVGGSPFVEYNVMHSSWQVGAPDPSTFVAAIKMVMSFSGKLTTKEEKDWYKKWQRVRAMPSQNILTKMTSIVRNEMSLERDVIVHLDNQQTIIRTTDLQSLIQSLMEMEWIKQGQPFTFVQNQIVQYHSESPQTGSIDWLQPIHIEPPKVPEIGGFYMFKTTVEGTCTEKQDTTYSVRDKDGTVHVLYKKAVSNIITKQSRQ